MKAYETMAWLVIFNLVVSIFGGLGIIVFKLSTASISTLIISVSMGTILGWMATSAIIGYFTRSSRPATSYWAYYLFGSIFWGTYASSLIVIDSLVSTIATFGLTLGIYSIFTAIMGYVFVSTIIQMTTGGWRSYQ